MTAWRGPWQPIPTEDCGRLMAHANDIAALQKQHLLRTRRPGQIEGASEVSHPIAAVIEQLGALHNHANCRVVAAGDRNEFVEVLQRGMSMSEE
jgi:hypothetical protein